PHMRAGRCIDHLTGHAHTAAGLAHAAFYDISHAKLAADLLHVHGAALVGEGRVSRDYEKPVYACQAGDDVIDHSISEILLLWISAQVRKRQDRDGRFLR